MDSEGVITFVINHFLAPNSIGNIHLGRKMDG
jgi:hypothetical protein